MLVAGLDFETTGLDPNVHRVIEVGAVLWDTDTGCPNLLLSNLCWTEGAMPEMEAEAAAANGISVEVLKKYGRPHEYVFECLNELIDEGEAIVAHNGSTFDNNFYHAECGRVGVPPVERTWIDTMTDIKYPVKITTRKLVHLAAEHCFLNPFAHRAIFDVLTMLRVFQNYDPVVALEYARQPFVTLRAMVSYDDRDKAKVRGYHWDGDSRRWLKTMRLPDAILEKSEAPFRVVEVTK